MLTSSQRAQLKSLAMSLDPVVMVGKNGITDNVVTEAVKNLKAHELIKGKVLDTALMSSKEVLAELAGRCGAEPVQAIGSKFVMYKENPDIPSEKRIKLKK